MKTASVFLVAVFALTLGCSKGGGDSGDKPTSDGGDSVAADTPQAAFDAFAAATREKDWKTAVNLVSDETKSMLVFGMIMQAGFMTMDDESKGKELEALMKKYGLDEEGIAGDAPGAGPPDVNALVEDLPGFVEELAGWIKANSSSDEDDFPSLTEVANIQIDGDTATGMAKTEMGDQPVAFQKVGDSWKVHLPMGPPPTPSLEEMELDFSDLGAGKIGSMQYEDKSSELNYSFAYRAQFFEDPCVVLVLTAEEVAEQKRNDLQEQLKQDPQNSMFFADGPSVSITLTPEGEVMSVFAWIDNSSLSFNRGVALDIEIADDHISGKAGMAPTELNGSNLQFKALIDTDIAF